MDWKDIDRIRVPGFTLARRGYDKHEVDRFLARLADWLETDAPNEIGEMAVTRKLELVGKSTSHILMTTEQQAAELRNFGCALAQGFLFSRPIPADQIDGLLGA